MFESIKNRAPGGYIYEKLSLFKRIHKVFPTDVLAKLLYHIWKYRYWHLFQAQDEEGLLRRYFTNDFLETAGRKWSVPRKEDMDTFMWEYADLMMPYLAEKYDYTKIESLFDEGPYELNENLSVKKGDVVIDCGANLGLFCSAVADRAQKIYAFEPSEKLCREYLEPLQTVYPNIVIRNQGVAAESLERDFFFYPESSGSSKMKDINNASTSEDIPDRKYEKQKISCISMDDFVEFHQLLKVDFIKADIEGAERELLMGAQKTLARFSPTISICTYHLPDDKEVLEQLILDANPKYQIHHAYKKLYAYVEK